MRTSIFILMMAALLAACGGTNTAGDAADKEDRNKKVVGSPKAAAPPPQMVVSPDEDEIEYEEEEEDDFTPTEPARLVPIPKEAVKETSEYQAAITGLWRQLGINCDEEGMNCDPTNGADLVFMQTGGLMIGPNKSEYDWDGNTLLIGTDKGRFDILRLSDNVLLIKDQRNGSIIRYSRKHPGVDD